jgi:hypothetical protein
LILSKAIEVYFLLEMLFSCEKFLFLLSKAMPPENRQNDRCANMLTLHCDRKMQTEFVMCIMKQLRIRRFFSLFTLDELVCCYLGAFCYISLVPIVT